MAQFQTMLEGTKKAHQLRLESIEVQSDALDINNSVNGVQGTPWTLKP